MILRSKHIKSRFAIQILLTIGYAAIIYLVAHYSSLRKEKFAAIQSLCNEASCLVTETYLNQQQLLHVVAYDDEFISSGTNNEIISFHEDIKFLEKTMSYLAKESQISTSLSQTKLPDTVQMMIDSWENNFNELVLGLQERGNSKTGLINQIQGISNEIITHLTNDPFSIGSAYRLKELEVNYLAAHDHDLIYEMLGLVDELEYTVDTTALFIPFADFTLSLSQYKEHLEHLQFIDDERLGYLSDTTGYLYTSQNAYLNTQEYVIKQNTFISSLLTKIKRNTTFYQLILYLIITLFYIYSLIVLSRILASNLAFIKENLEKLSKGHITGLRENKKARYEFLGIDQHIQDIGKSQNERKKFLDNLLKQKFNVEFALLGKRDVIGKTLLALKENYRKFREEQDKHNEENKLRRYANEGLAKFADVMRISNDTTELSDNFIRELVKYMDALQGGLFLIDENNDKNLNLTASFAFDRKKYMNKTVTLGEGLIGTCALEKKTINLTDVPEDYVIITSGLGDAPPRNILIIPAIQDDELIGVVELASLKVFEEHEINLAEHIASNLATTLLSVKNTSKTAKLLAKSQQQAAEMSEQEEEMRQNMEELKATQEESARREEEFTSIIEAINESYYVVEYDTDGTIYRTNDKINNLLQKTSSDLLGFTHKEVFNSTFELNQDNIKDIQLRILQNEIEEIQVGKQKYKLKHSLTPIISPDGELTRILNLIEAVEE